MKYLILLLLSGCASTPYWTQAGPPSKEYVWTRESSANISELCSGHLACAFQIKQTGVCWIYSVFSEEQAKREQSNDGALWLREHELKHCNGWAHQT
jgi:hypothetical protein